MRRTKVYFNLHKKLWSMKSMDSGPDYGLVKEHATAVHLLGVMPKVSDKGRERVRREGKKNVHAGLVGRVNWFDASQRSIDYAYRYYVNNKRSNATWREITYNPYKHTSFVYKDDTTPFRGANEALLLDKRVFVR